MEAWTTIRYLHAQGKSIRTIAKELSIARNTVRAALREDNPPQYSRPERTNPKIEPFVEQIEHMFFEQQFIGSRILRELKAAGYEGRSTALYDYLRDLKANKPNSRVTERFETPPAKQGQFDWSPYTISIGGHTIKVTVFCLTLAFSRRKFYWPSLNETQISIFEAVEAALNYFGGSPKELLVDNPRAFVTDANPEHFCWNNHFLELCGHYSIKPVACQPARPRTKGKVERPFFYLEQHLIKGNTWDSFDAFARELARFTVDELDCVIHSTTGERPIDRFQQEKDLLTALPPLPFVGTHEEMRKVSWDCLVSFGASRYSVPWPYASKQVWLRSSQGLRLVVRNQKGEEIAVHTIAAKKGSTIINPAHYEGLRNGPPKTRILLEKSFNRIFPDYDWFVEGIFIQNKNNGIDHLRAVLALAELYLPEALIDAFAAAKKYNTYTHRFIRGLLEASGATKEQQAVASLRWPSNNRTEPDSAQRGSSLSLTGDLNIYQQILEAAK